MEEESRNQSDGIVRRAVLALDRRRPQNLYLICLRQIRQVKFSHLNRFGERNDKQIRQQRLGSSRAFSLPQIPAVLFPPAAPTWQHFGSDSSWVAVAPLSHASRKMDFADDIPYSLPGFSMRSDTSAPPSCTPEKGHVKGRIAPRRHG